MGVPSNSLKEYYIELNNHKFEFINKDNVSEMTIKKAGMLSREYLVLEGESVIGKLKHNPMATEAYDGPCSVLLGVVEKAEQHKYFDPTGIGVTG